MMNLISIAKEKAQDEVSFYKDPETETSLKIFSGVATATIVAMLVALPLAINGTTQEKNYHAKGLDHLDTNISYIFQSTAECRDKNFASQECFTAQNKAIEMANSRLTKWEYAGEDQCKLIHGKCSSKTTEKEDSGVPFIAGSTSNISSSYMMSEATKTTNETTKSYPLIVAWQMSSVDPEIVQPLYSATEKGYAIRRDGQFFELNR